MCKDNYPPGAKYDSNAPWNEEHKTPREIEVAVSITLSKTIKIQVADYQEEYLGKDEDGYPILEVNYDSCNLEDAVRLQAVLPDEAYKFVSVPKFADDLKNWIVDDFNVCIE